MSTLGKTLSLATRQKISIAKTKYTKEYLIEKCDSYLTRLLELPDDQKELPSITGYCLEIGINKTEIYNYIEKYPEVSQLVAYISDLQEQSLLNKSYQNKLNPSFATFLLRSKHNYNDTPTQLTQNNNFNISPDVLADAFALIKEKNTKK